MYAVLRTGGKQYTVRENEIVQVEKLDSPEGGQIVFDDVLLVNDKENNLVGTPTVDGAKITGKVLKHGLDKKIIGRTYKPKKSTAKRYGHRQPFTQVLIEKISLK